MAYNARGQLKDPMQIQTASLTLPTQDIAGQTIMLVTSLGLKNFEDQNWIGFIQFENAGAGVGQSQYISNRRTDRFYLNHNISDAGLVVNFSLHGRMDI